MRFKIRLKLILNNSQNDEEYEYIIEEYFKRDYFFMMENLESYLNKEFNIDDLQKIYDYLKNVLQIDDEIFVMINKRKKATKNFSLELDYDALQLNSKKIKFKSQGRTINYLELIEFNSKRYFTIIADDLSIEVYLTKTQDQKQTIESNDDQSEKPIIKKYQPKNISVSSDDDSMRVYFNHNNVLCHSNGNLKRRRFYKEIRIKRYQQDLKKNYKIIKTRFQILTYFMQYMF